VAGERTALGDYLRTLHKIPVLTREEELALGVRVQGGDAAALDLLVRHNLRFVVSTVKGTRDWGAASLPYDDLIAAGNEAMLDAARRWTPVNGARFITYAKPFILRGVVRAVDNESNTIRLPVNVCEEVRLMKYHENALAQANGTEPTQAQIAHAMGSTPKRVGQLRGFLLREPSSIEMHHESSNEDADHE
jgi:RNA polymerase primary sigma factor